MNKQFHNFLVGVSVLPALLVVPAAAMHHVAGEDEVIQDVEDLNLTDFGLLYNTSSGPINGALFADAGKSGSLVQENITIGGTGEDAIGRAVQAKNGGALVIGDRDDTQSINISTADGYGILALGNTGKTKGSKVEVYGQSVNVTALGGTAVHVGNNTKPSEGATNQASITIDADTINVSSPYIGFGAMSEGRLYITGDTTINAENAILTRGDAQTYINKDTNHKLKMNGNIAFDYDKATSGTPVDAIVDVTLAGVDSYWTGNTIASHGTGRAPDDTYMRVDSISVTVKDGATWNATTIIDNTDDETVGSWYVAMNNLTIDNGIVNIADTTRGIIVENANIADATFNGGVLNIGEMTLTGGTSIFNNNVAGVDDDSVLTVNSGATMNIGTNNVDVHKIVLNGNMLATLRSGDDAQITANNFSGNGTLKLTMKEAGTYQVFGDKTFSKIAWDDSGLTTDSPIYNLVWNGGEVTATRKTIEEIADSNELSDAAAATVSNLTDSTSDALNDLAVKMQEKLAEAVDDESKAAVAKEVEKATKAIHPETESVTQSVASSVQNTVTNLASARMSAPTMGRNGGDLNLTSGGVWAQGLYNRTKQHDSFHGDTRGIAAGFDGTINRVWTVGAGYSYAYSDITGSERDTEIDSNTIFVYGQYKPAEWYVNAVLNYTMSDYSEKGTALGTPVTADYDVDSFGGVLTAGYDFASGITPELGLRYMHVSSDDYTNSLGVKTDSKDTDYLTGILGAKYAFNIAAGKYINLIPQLNAAVKYDMLSDGNSATVAMPGVNSYTIDGERLSRFGGEFGIGLGMKYRSLDLSVNYDIDVRKDYTSQTGMLKLRYNF